MTSSKYDNNLQFNPNIGLVVSWAGRCRRVVRCRVAFGGLLVGCTSTLGWAGSLVCSVSSHSSIIISHLVRYAFVVKYALF